MRKILRGRVALAVLLSLLLVVSATSAVVYATGSSEEGLATQRYLHLHGFAYLCNDQIVKMCDGEVAPPSQINGNLFTFTHPGTPNGAKIKDWSYENTASEEKPGQLKGLFVIWVEIRDCPVGGPSEDPCFIYGPI